MRRNRNDTSSAGSPAGDKEKVIRQHSSHAGKRQRLFTPRVLYILK